MPQTFVRPQRHVDVVYSSNDLESKPEAPIASDVPVAQECNTKNAAACMFLKIKAPAAELDKHQSPTC